MFEGSLVESTSLLRSRNRWPAVASVGVQALLVAVLVAVPLLHPEVVSMVTPHMTLYAPALPRPVPPPLPVHLVHVEANASSAPAALAAPAAQLTHVMISTSTPVDAPVMAEGMNLGPARPNLPDALVGSGTAGPRVVAVSPTGGGSGTRTSGKPLPVSTGVLAGLLLEPIRPVYPPIARVSRTEGDVVVQAVISRTGRMESAHVISGNMMLQQSALDAVRSARYRPYLLNGEPTEVETTITVRFHLGG
jgi:protein TonB